MKSLISKDKEVRITRAMVKKAVTDFLQRGGRIKILPAEPYHSSQVVGGDKWGAYEALHRLEYASA